jgi:hypothetical protein
LITSHDMALTATALVQPAPPLAIPTAVPFRERILLMILFVTVLSSSVAFIEPSPHDVLMGVLAVAGLIAGIRFHRALVLPFLLLLVWNLSGMMALLNVPGQEKTVQYAVTSFYLATAAILFAMLFAENTMMRLSTMRTAYILTAVIIALCSAAGYFHIPGAETFVRDDRALGAFKDPNVFGPFLILPAMLLLEPMLRRRIDILNMIFTGIILFGLLLSFSRGSWFHFVVSAMVVVALVFLTVPTPKARMRVLGLTIASIAVVSVLIVILLSIDSIGSMFKERAHLIQYYDVGQGGRFRLQELALGSVLDYPNGMGPFEFARVHGLQQHNVYLQAFLVYGWAGAMSYFILLLSTVWIGFRTALKCTPWQGYSIAALGAFIGEMAEGFVIDTDHWRHFYLILGIIWGLAAAGKIIQQRLPHISAAPVPQ